MATAFLTAALAVRPWQFAGVFILLGVLVLVPMLVPPGAGPPSGALKFVAFHALGVPFLIIAGTLMEGLESIPAGLPLTLRPGIFLGLSFILLLGVFPFHGWIPGLVDDYEPLPVAFVLVLVPSFIGVLGLQLIDRYAFLRNSDEFFTLLRAVGILTVGAGSALVIVQRRVGRILGFAALIETGLLLLAIGSGPRTGPALYFPLTAARSAGFLAWGGGLAALHKRGMRFDRLRLLAADRATVLIGLVVLAGLFSTAGFPLLPGFPVKYRLAAVLAGIDPTAVFAVWLGMTATAAAGLRTLVSMLSSSGQAAPAEGETQ
jgi:NADH:ubiquinone oxidoreductase subunit 2 (subunit N)